MSMYLLILQHVLKCGEGVAEPALVLPLHLLILLLTVVEVDTLLEI
jgi:hypothetical protein